MGTGVGVFSVLPDLLPPFLHYVRLSRHFCYSKIVLKLIIPDLNFVAKITLLGPGQHDFSSHRHSF